MEFVRSYTVGGSAVIIGTLLYFLYWWVKNFNYWKIRGVPYHKPNWFFGNTRDLISNKCTWLEYSHKCYQSFKGNGFGGIFVFRSPVLIVCDPKLIEKVLVEDFTYFEDRVLLEDQEILTNSLFFGTGEKWRILRFKLLSLFTPKKVKEMFHQILKSCDFILECTDRYIEKGKSIEMEPLVFLYTTKVIASCTFGIQIMSDPSKCKKYIELFNSVIRSSTARLLKNCTVMLMPKLARVCGIKAVNKEVADFFIHITKETIQYRLKSNVKRYDFLQMISSLKEGRDKIYRGKIKLSKEDEIFNQCNNPALEKKISADAKMYTDECIASILFNFLTSGPTPMFVTISFALFEVAKNKLIQKKLQEEIDSTIMKHNECTFEAIKDMCYLDQVIQETLRLYTYSPSILRIANKPYRIPGTNVIIEKGMPVYIPIAGIHLDPQYYQSPEEFNPERFEGHNYKATPFFMPFGYGPRICICIRFAVIMMKVCIAKILFKYTVNISNKMKLPLMFDLNFLFPKANGGVWLSFEKRECRI